MLALAASQIILAQTSQLEQTRPRAGAKYYSRYFLGQCKIITSWPVDSNKR